MLANEPHMEGPAALNTIGADPATLGRRRRRDFHSASSLSSVYLTTITVLTVAASYIWISPAAGYLSSPHRAADGRRVFYNSHERHRISPFGLEREMNGPPTRLFLAASPNEKEEWRAILASFQLYKAAYGDLKIPIRFVVPSMAPWPGKISHRSCICSVMMGGII